MANNYGAESITVLEGLEAVRKRPGMYIGSTSSKGLHHLVWEIVDNSVDEALAGVCDKITVKILEGNVIEVTDNGRGIPVAMHKTGKSTLEVVMTVLHAGGKFDNDNYKVSGGLHGVGISVVNALSEWVEATVTRDGQIVRQRFERGVPVSAPEKIGDAPLDAHGTVIRFKADDEIFETTVYDYSVLESRLKELSYLNKGLKIKLIDERKKDDIREEEFHFEGGIKDFLNEITDNEKIVDDVIYMADSFETQPAKEVEAVDENGNVYIKKVGAKIVEVEIAMNYTTAQREIVYSFVNNINTHEGGTHVSGFRTALTRTINDIAKQMNLIKEKSGTFQGTDVREGLVCIISVKIPEPQFEGQTKTKLGNSEVTGIVSNIVGNNLKFYLEDHPKAAEKIIEKMAVSKKAREAAKKARELVLRKNNLEVGSLPGKLADCSSKDPAESEIFIVEGNSAGGSAKQGRDRRFQAILPLRGKILNVEKASVHRTLENAEIRDMITAFGAGFGDDMNLEKLRYHKIVIMTDADVDGAHIRTLMLTFFYRHLRELINEGYIYIAQPPLYKIQAGKSIRYAYSDEQLKKVTKVLENDGKKYTIQRYKGLGEMNPEQLWETTLDPEVRTLLKVTMEDASYADKMFNILMGDKVEPRRRFIEENASYVKNLDI
ncbi:DNA topoisomerase (ATP-hydrolyzing) subunit B [Leptotrichia sp. oral taxon 218]|jgi:DNA gyrase, B subunit|uniref:DNA topoisomerase (ATP-hydrolyzing) subunit B n=1 Tax=Leptotrichia sp. oral taxon 218 TaxID=712361 RepID=UPI001B8B49D9|nr:DNA topoisomerase (ATP-hydrolyzing) subunit B [Leptotrichia sp. oral taxon 218]QUB95238.1 DNA topoisomerase (ATP-hydrolyzing) subunit B [Leptotrichia sp. oral taxon 218]